MKQKIKLAFWGALLLNFSLALSARAQGGGVSTPINNPAPNALVNISDFGTLLSRAINTFLTFAGAVAVVFLMIGGFQYVSSRGTEEGMEKAKKTVTAAIIGIVVIVMAYAIVAIVNTILTSSS